MKIKIEGRFKSLYDFESDELNEFTVITGKNGSGKSQLIEAIRLKTLNQTKTNGNNFTIKLNPDFNRIQINGIYRGKINSVGNDAIRNALKRHIEYFKTLKPIQIEVLNNIIKSNSDINQSLFKKENILETFRKSGYTNTDEIIDKLSKEVRIGFSIPKDQRISAIISLFNLSEIQLYKSICNFTGKNFIDINESTFYGIPISSNIIDNPDMFLSQIENIFYCFARNRELNSYKNYKKISTGENNNSISDIEFLKRNTPPWETINDIFNEHSVNFMFKGIESGEFSPEIPITFKLIKKSTQKEILYENLSSGESTIIALILKLFSSDYYQNNLKFPQLIILDEPDAPLHPEMSKLLISVLYKTFVKKLGIKVIMTTHSPSTIALCPEESIYQLKNEPTCSLTKISKDEALEMLTEFIPTLSIDYKNHKQLFVESPTDMYYYQTIFNKLNSENKFTNNLYFISNGFGKGNCQQVINIVDALRVAGNKTSYGIIDWDNKNQTKNFTTVHGENKRYSIENYILDPIYIITLFLKLKAYNIHKELNLDTTYNEYNIGSETDEILQTFTNWLINKIYEKFPAFKKDDDTRSTISYFNKKSILIPNWYLNMNGHKELVVKLKETFPLLKEKYGSDIELENELITVIGKCYPFIPNDTVELLKKI